MSTIKCPIQINNKNKNLQYQTITNMVIFSKFYNRYVYVKKM